MAKHTLIKIYFILTIIAGAASFVGSLYLFMWTSSHFFHGFTLEAIFIALILFGFSLIFFIVAHHLNHVGQMRFRK